MDNNEKIDRAGPLRPLPRLWLTLLIWVAFFALFPPAHAQHPDPFGASPLMVHFTRKQYDAHHQNWSLTCDDRGRLYAGNGAGLLAYDGAFWSKYSLPKGQIVRAAALDEAGKVFTGGFGEMGFWEKRSEEGLKYVSLGKPVNPQGNPEEIWHIVVRNREVWFQSFSMIYRYDYQTIKPLLPPGNLMFMEDLNGRLVFQQIGSGLVEVDADLKFIPFPGTGSLADKIVKTLIPLSDYRWLVGTERHGLWVYDVLQQRLSPWPNAASEYLADAQINRGLRLRNGNLAFGAILGGLVVLDPEGNIRWQVNESNGLQNNTVLSMAEDPNGNLWLGLDKGVDFIALSAPVSVYYDLKGQLGVAYAAALWQGRLFIGTNRGLFERKMGNAVGAAYRLVSGSQGQVWELRPERDELIVGHNEGAFAYRENSLRRISPVTGGWTTLPKPGKSDTLLQGAYTGLTLLTRGENGWQFGGRVAGFDDPVREMALDASGNLWVFSPFRGLYCLRLQSDWRRVLSAVSIALPPSIERLNEMSVYARGDSVRITVHGASWLAVNGDPPRLAPLPAESGAGKTWRLSADLQLHVNQGQAHFRRGSREIRLPFQLVQGFERSIQLDSAHLLLCLEEGFAILKLAEFGRWTPAVVPPPEIAFVRVGPGGAAWRPGATRPGPLRLPPQPEELLVGFAQPGNLGAARYRYRLSPRAPQWSSWQTEPQARFLSLRPGDYLLEIQAEGSDTVASLRFEVAHTWYETPAARAGAAVLIFFIALSLIRFNRKWLQRQRQKLEAEKARLVHEERIRVANEQLQAAIRSKSTDLANSTMHLVQKNELLIRIQRELSRMRAQPGPDLRAFDRLLRLIEENLSNEEEWTAFEANFNEIHDQFFKKLLEEHPDLTPGDLRLAALLRLNLSSKEIAPLLSISIRGVENKRYRLRKKLGLDGDANLIEHLMRY